MDAVAAKLMASTRSAAFIRLAHEKGLGMGDVSQIELVGDDISGENWNFQGGAQFPRVSGLAGLVWPTKSLQKLICTPRL